jgi:hypothetical protein
MNRLQNWMWFFLLGSLWGVFEGFGGELLFEYNVPFKSVILGVWALFLLGIGRGVVNKAGTSTVIGGFATLYKLANTSPYFCHLVAIFAIGVVFDIFATLLIKKESKSLVRISLTGIFSAYSARLVFALMSIYIFKFQRWIRGGMSYFLGHVFVRGSVAAVLAGVLVPLGYRLGSNGDTLFKKYPKWAYSGALIILIGLWSLGRFIPVGQ